MPNPQIDFNPDLRPAEDFVYSPAVMARALAVIQLALSDYVHGLDLSDWRPNVNIKTAKQNGNRFIIPKATQGNYLRAETWPGYRDETLEKGLALFAFHYWDASIDPVEQAKYFYDYVKNVLTGVPVWDVEKYGNQGVLTTAAAATKLDAGLQETEQLFGRPVMVYTNRDSWQVLTANSDILLKFLLWVASWTTAANPLLPIPAVEWLIWQYTNAYRLPDYPSGLDGNRFNGNEANFEAWLQKLNGPTLPPSGEHDHPELQAQIDLLNARYQAISGEQTIIREQLANQAEALEQLQADVAGLAARAIQHEQKLANYGKRFDNIAKSALDEL